MNTAEIVAALRAKAPEVVEGLTDTAVKKLVVATLGVVRDSIAEAAPGRVVVSSLGRFTIRENAKEADAEGKRKVLFMAAKAADEKVAKVDPEARAAKKAARKAAKKKAD
ncbi:MAG: hypothetical protein LCH73_01820 [Proteobacteria bacterium]|nr:hypothetical protein [Pseudomonadota bacterium]